MSPQLTDTFQIDERTNPLHFIGQRTLENFHRFLQSYSRQSIWQIVTARQDACPAELLFVESLEHFAPLEHPSQVHLHRIATQVQLEQHLQVKKNKFKFMFK